MPRFRASAARVASWPKTTATHVESVLPEDARAEASDRLFVIDQKDRLWSVAIRSQHVQVWWNGDRRSGRPRSVRYEDERS